MRKESIVTNNKRKHPECRGQTTATGDGSTQLPERRIEKVQDGDDDTAGAQPPNHMHPDH